MMRENLKRLRRKIKKPGKWTAEEKVAIVKWIWLTPYNNPKEKGDTDLKKTRDKIGKWI